MLTGGRGLGGEGTHQGTTAPPWLAGASPAVPEAGECFGWGFTPPAATEPQLSGALAHPTAGCQPRLRLPERGACATRCRQLLQPLQKSCCREQHRHDLPVDPKARAPMQLQGSLLGDPDPGPGCDWPAEERMATGLPAPGWKGTPAHPSQRHTRPGSAGGHILDTSPLRHHELGQAAGIPTHAMCRVGAAQVNVNPGWC